MEEFIKEKMKHLAVMAAQDMHTISRHLEGLNERPIDENTKNLIRIVLEYASTREAAWTEIAKRKEGK